MELQKEWKGGGRHLRNIYLTGAQTVHYEMCHIRLHIIESLAGLWSPVDNCHRIQYYKLRIGTSVKESNGGRRHLRDIFISRTGAKAVHHEVCHIRLHISESLARVQSTTVITYNIANGESLIYTYTHSSSSTTFKGLSQCRTLTLGLSWDSQVRCQSWKFITLSVKTPSVSSLRKYSNSTLTDILK